MIELERVRGSLGLGLSIGVALGLCVGAAAMYLGLRLHDGNRAASPPPPHADAAPGSEGGSGSAKPKRHRPRRGAVSAEDRGWGETDDAVATEPTRVQLSAADRAMEWRGDDTTRPPQKLDMGDDSSARSLDDGEIRSTIESQSGPLQSCVVTSATNTDLTGTISIKLVVDGSGRVSKTKVSAFRYLFERGLLACIRNATARLHFPATGAPTLVTVPIQLH